MTDDEIVNLKGSKDVYLSDIWIIVLKFFYWRLYIEINKHGYCSIFLISEQNSLEQGPVKLATQQIYLQQNYKFKI